MKIVMNTDGGARGNPGPAGIGVVIQTSNLKSQNIKEISEYIGETTNNQAEYKALIAGLEYLSTVDDFDGVECRLDSELVVKQLNGEYKMKNEGLRPLFDRVRFLVSEINKPVKFVHIYREENKDADRLVNEAIDKYIG